MQKLKDSSMSKPVLSIVINQCTTYLFGFDPEEFVGKVLRLLLISHGSFEFSFVTNETILEINRTYPKDGDWESYEIFIRKGNIEALTGSNKYEVSDEKILTPDWAIAKAAELNSLSVAQIKSLGIKIIGDLDRSDFSKIPTGLNKPVTTISIETVARAMIGVDMSSLQKMHGKVISREFIYRAKRALKRRLHLK